MPDNAFDLAYLLKLPPKKAIAYFKAKDLALTWDWEDLWQAGHTRFFTVAKCMRMDVLQDIHDELLKAQEQGLPFQQFKKNLTPMLQAKGWWGYKFVSKPDGTLEKVLEGSPRRLETIYRTNMQSAFMAGRWKAFEENVKSRPYYQYVAVMDSKTRPAHRLLHGKVFRHDDIFWKTHWPPLDFRCRCRARALSEADIKERGLSVESGEGNIVWKDVVVSQKNGEVRPVAFYHDPTTDREIPTGPGFSYNPGMTDFKADLDKYSPDIKASLTRR